MICRHSSLSIPIQYRKRYISENYFGGKRKKYTYVVLPAKNVIHNRNQYCLILRRYIL